MVSDDPIVFCVFSLLSLDSILFLSYSLATLNMFSAPLCSSFLMGKLFQARNGGGKEIEGGDR